MIFGNKMPTRCNRGFYYRSYCLRNMFRASLCPSWGAEEYYTVVAACGISCCDFQVAGLMWSWGLCVRFAGCYSPLHVSSIKQIIDSAGRPNVLQKRQLYVVKKLNKKLATENAIITLADKGKTTVIIYSKEYSEKVQSFLTANNFNTLTKDPTDKFQKLIHKTLQESNLI